VLCVKHFFVVLHSFPVPFSSEARGPCNQPGFAGAFVDQIDWLPGVGVFGIGVVKCFGLSSASVRGFKDGYFREVRQTPGAWRDCTACFKATSNLPRVWEIHLGRSTKLTWMLGTLRQNGTPSPHANRCVFFF
jgi:hypothetical protein